MEDPFTGKALLSNSRVLRANTWAEFDSYPWVDPDPIRLQSNMSFSRGPSDVIFDLLSYSGSTRTFIYDSRRQRHNAHHRGPVGNTSDLHARDPCSIPSAGILMGFFLSGLQISFIKNLTELFYLSMWIVISQKKFFNEMFTPFWM
jgi:hypothetical protein